MMFGEAFHKLQALSNSLQLASSRRGSQLTRANATRVSMVDKLEIRVPKTSPYTAEFSRVYQEAAGNPRYGFRASQHYLQTGDLRQFGYSSVLHSHNKHGKKGDHKLELIDTGRMTYGQMVNEVERVFDVNAQKLDVMRVDFAADVEGTPVGYFRDRMRVKYKQWHARIGTMEFSEMGKREMQTLYYGKRPNTVRVYDKVAEYRYQYAKLCRKPVTGDPELMAEMEAKFPTYVASSQVERYAGTSPDAEIPPFHELFGVPERGYVLTRVERVIAAGRVPEQIGTVSRLRNAPNYNPFEYLQISEPGAPEPSPYDFSFQEYCTGMFLRSKVEQEDGMQWVSAFMREHVGAGNLARELRRYQPFFPPETDEAPRVTEGQLFEFYRESVSRQLAA